MQRAELQSSSSWHLSSWPPAKELKKKVDDGGEGYFVASPLHFYNLYSLSDFTNANPKTSRMKNIKRNAKNGEKIHKKKKMSYRNH